MTEREEHDSTHCKLTGKYCSSLKNGICNHDCIDCVSEREHADNIRMLNQANLQGEAKTRALKTINNISNQMQQPWYLRDLQLGG